MRQTSGEVRFPVIWDERKGFPDRNSPGRGPGSGVITKAN